MPTRTQIAVSIVAIIVISLAFQITEIQAQSAAPKLEIADNPFASSQLKSIEKRYKTESFKWHIAEDLKTLTFEIDGVIEAHIDNFKIEDFEHLRKSDRSGFFYLRDTNHLIELFPSHQLVNRLNSAD